jgi:hypothetical protein
MCLSARASVLTTFVNIAFANFAVEELRLMSEQYKVQ